MKKNDFSKQKFYLSELKEHTKDFTVSFKKRYDIFPWKVLNKVKREFYNEEVYVSSTKFTVKSLIKEVEKIQKSLYSRLKPSYYNFILRSYIRDAKDLEEKELKRIYQNYKAELDKEFKSCKLDLEFSISALKSLTKFIKEKSETVSESVKVSDIDTLIFDFGGVLVKSVMLKGRRDLFGDVKISDEDLDIFIQSYFSHADEFEGCSYEDSKILYKTYLPKRLHKYIDKVFDVVFGTTVPFDYSVPLIQSLKEAGYKLYYLSNWNKTGFELCEKNGSFPFKKYFDGGIVSYEVGLLKPDNKIYELLIEKYHINPKTAMFFDDKKENIAAANKVGLNTTLFTQKTVKELMDMTKFVKESVDVIPKNDSTKAVLSFLKKYGISNVSMIAFVSDNSSSVDFFGDFKGTRYSADKLGDLVDTSKIDSGKSRILDIIHKDKKYNKDKLNIVYIKADGSIIFKYDIKEAKTNKYKTDWKNSNQPKSNQNKKVIKESEEMRLEFLDENNNVCDVNDTLLEMAIDLCLEDDDEFSEELATEGMNSDVKKMRKNYKKNYKEIVKTFKKCMKNNDFNGARKALAEAEKVVKDFSTDLSKCESDEIPSLIIGYFLQSLKDMLQLTLVALIPIVGIPAASIASMVKTIEQIVTSVRTVMKKSKNNEQVTLSDFNIYKNQAIRVADKLAAQIKTCKGKVDEKEKKIKEIEKEQKKKVNVKESAEYKEKKLSIYESCQKGEITLEERESLLSDLDKEAVLQECESNEEASMSSREKCKAVIEALYEKCSKGEITLEEREYLIEKAQSQFLESGEQQPSCNNKDGIDPKQEQEAKKLESELKKAGEQPVGDK